MSFEEHILLIRFNHYLILCNHIIYYDLNEPNDR